MICVTVKVNNITLDGNTFAYNISRLRKIPSCVFTVLPSLPSLCVFFCRIYVSVLTSTCLIGSK